MEITYILSGTVSVTPGTAVSRTLDLPPSIPEAPLPDSFFSKVAPSDPANGSLFKFLYFNGGTPPGGRDGYLGVQQILVTYTLTGASPIDIDFQLVWLDAELPGAIAYGGD